MVTHFLFACSAVEGLFVYHYFYHGMMLIVIGSKPFFESGEALGL